MQFRNNTGYAQNEMNFFTLVKQIQCDEINCKTMFNGLNDVKRNNGVTKCSLPTLDANGF